MCITIEGVVRLFAFAVRLFLRNKEPLKINTPSGCELFATIKCECIVFVCILDEVKECLKFL